MDERTKIDVNQEHTIAGVTYDSSEDIMNLTLNPVDKRLRVDSAISDVGDGATAANQTLTNTKLDSLIAGMVTADPWSGYGKYDVLTTDPTYFYKCYQNASDAWIIVRIRKATSYETTYAKGSSGTAAAWANYESQSYDTYANTF